jgi:hypothetical protein
MSLSILGSLCCRGMEFSSAEQVSVDRCLARDVFPLRLSRKPLTALIAIARYRHRHQAARTPLAEGILPEHLLDTRLQGYELQPFLLITNCNVLCPDSDPPPASAASCSRHATASPPAPGSRPCHPTTPSRRRACVWTRPLLAPHPPRSAPPLLASVPRSSALPCACSSTYSLPLSSHKSYSALCGLRGAVRATRAYVSHSPSCDRWLSGPLVTRWIKCIQELSGKAFS